MHTNSTQIRGPWGGGRGGILYFCFVMYPYIWYWSWALRNNVTARSVSNLTIVEKIVILYSFIQRVHTWLNLRKCD